MYFRSEFSKLTLATSRFVTVESTNAQNEKNIPVSQTVMCTTTTTTTTMTRVLGEPAAEGDDVSCAQKPRVLLYESTRDDDILTDDDTDSVGTSIDSKELESGLKEISQLTTQDRVANIDRIDTQMQSLSFISPLNRSKLTSKSEDNVQNMSRQFDQLELQNENEQEKNDTPSKCVLSCSVQTLSSNDSMDHADVSAKEIQDKNESYEVIVLSDSDTDEAPADEVVPRSRIVSQEPPLKPSYANSNDNVLYNLSSLDDDTAMQRVNNFFDNAPFVEPAENSFNTSHMSNSIREDIFVPETTDEESIDEENVQQIESEAKNSNEQIESNQPNFSDNNIIVDIPVIKSTSDQPRQIIRSTSGVRLTASRSSPIIKTTAGIIRTPGSSIRVKQCSNNGQVNIAAKININIQIVEDSSEESSEDNKPTRKSQAIQSSEECQHNHSNASSNSEVERATKNTHSKVFEDPKAHTPAIETPTKTPSTASKLRQFEFVPPRSMSKIRDDNAEIKVANKTISSETSENNDGFQIDKSIPISPRDQKLLVRSY